MSSRYGITVPFEGISLHDHRETFKKIADLGYTDIWSSEVDGSDGFTPLILAAAWESRLNLGIAVTPVYTRGAGLLAMTVAAMAEAAPGRFYMGIGASSKPVVEKWNGIAYDKPYARTRDVLRFLNKSLNGERIDEVFETFEVHGFKLSRPVAQKPPILLGALRQGMLQLAGREGDGAILNWLGANDVAQCVEQVGPDKIISARLFVVPTEDSETARFIGRRMISSYLTVKGYAEFHRWLGRDEILAPMWQAWEAGDRKLANEVIPDSVVDELIIHGSFDECREHIARYVEAGVQIPNIAVLPFGVTIDEAITGLAPR